MSLLCSTKSFDSLFNALTAPGSSDYRVGLVTLPNGLVAPAASRVECDPGITVALFSKLDRVTTCYRASTIMGEILVGCSLVASPDFQGDVPPLAEAVCALAAARPESVVDLASEQRYFGLLATTALQLAGKEL